MIGNSCPCLYCTLCAITHSMLRLCDGMLLFIWCIRLILSGNIIRDIINYWFKLKNASHDIDKLLASPQTQLDSDLKTNNLIWWESSIQSKQKVCFVLLAWHQQRGITTTTISHYKLFHLNLRIYLTGTIF